MSESVHDFVQLGVRLEFFLDGFGCVNDGAVISRLIRLRAAVLPEEASNETGVNENQ